MRIHHCLLASALLVTATAIAQTSPSIAPAAPKMTLDFHDQPIEGILRTITPKLNLIVMLPGPIDARLTVGSDGPVDASQAAILLNQALWDKGYRVWGPGPMSDKDGAAPPPGEASPPMVVMVGQRPTAGRPAEMRVWRHGSLARTSKTPAEIPGVPKDKNLALKYVNVPMSDILQDMEKQFGFKIEKLEIQEPVTLLSHDPASAGEMVELVNTLLNVKGLGLSVSIAEGKATLAIAPMRLEPSPARNQAIDFADAPLADVLAELGKRSGQAVINNAKPLRVTLHDQLKIDASGIADVGAAVASLNKQLEPDGVVIEQISHPGAVEKRSESSLIAWSIAEAKRTLVEPADPMTPRAILPSTWPGVDGKKTMRFQFAEKGIEELLQEMSDQFGFVLANSEPSTVKLTLNVPEPLNVDQAISLLDSVLGPMGRQAVASTMDSGKRTVLHVVTFQDATTYWKAESPDAKPPATNPK